VVMMTTQTLRCMDFDTTSPGSAADRLVVGGWVFGGSDLDRDWGLPRPTSTSNDPCPR